MARPSKGTAVLEAENRSHRTKQEIKQRSEAEAALLSGEELTANEAVRKNAVAHKIFNRVYALLKTIGKNDALYEAIINRYCMLQAECVELAEIKKEFMDLKTALKAEYTEGGGMGAAQYYKLLDEMQGNIISLDKQIQMKRKMMFDIEKECAMTISSAMRSIPKAPAKRENPLLEALRDE